VRRQETRLFFDDAAASYDPQSFAEALAEVSDIATGDLDLAPEGS
jgi:hypothetical protein